MIASENALGSSVKVPIEVLYYFDTTLVKIKRAYISNNLTHINQTSTLTLGYTSTFPTVEGELFICVCQLPLCSGILGHSSLSCHRFAQASACKKQKVRCRQRRQNWQQNQSSPLCTIYASCSLLSATTCTPYHWTSLLPCAM